MRYQRTNVEGSTYFFTLVTERRRPLFRGPKEVALFDDAIAKVRQRFPFEIVAQVVLPDHVHTVWTLPLSDANFPLRLGLIKEAFTRAYLRDNPAPVASPARRARREQGIWQRRFWEHLIRDDRDLAAHVDYIHLNPVHHGYAAAPRDWPYSTFPDWVARGVYETAWGSDEKPGLPDWAKRHE